ncbi:MarR family winged helix-turn-helix transcriptional regulator [Catenuloplanes indicus]|uniref:DNA-binding MarR family transcriptional regulator n=1 Tax=Catenuloplanes indicus TaxID=137267 RepID=A0AAE4AV50_9ACTN|nr:MarR family transcriptional regulator [Catenuloplanes indicus]MDQ0363617.1 DNA-binding MarR family transcriptional regulator [Catenuloplanes indicus]
MTTPQAGQIVALLREFTLANDRFADVFARRHHLHRTDLEAMAHLWIGELQRSPMTPTRLSAALSLSAPATSALLSRLERAGHIRRIPAQHDRRSRVLVLHERARDLTVAYFTPLGARLRAVVAEFTPSEADVIERFLRACVAATIEVTPAAGEEANPATTGGTAHTRRSEGTQPDER